MLQVSWIKTLDDSAEMIGVKPSPWRLFFKDPTLAWHLLTGTNHPARYRLKEPGAWHGARDAILSSSTNLMSHIYPFGSTSKAVAFIHTCYLLVGGLCLLILVMPLLLLLYIIF